VTPRFGALRIPAYRRYFALGLMSMVADNIEHVISYWVLFQTFHSPALAGFAVISHWVPFLLFSLYAGALADRKDCRRLIEISQALFMLASAAWGFLFLTGTLQMWHAVVILIVHGVAGMIGTPASQLIIHDMVPREDLPSAIRLNASSRYLSILLGPAIGGGLMLLLGPSWGIVANVLVYLPFSLFIGRVPFTGHLNTPVGERRSPGLADVRRAFAIARTIPGITTMIVLAGAFSFFVGNAFQAQMPEYAEYLGADTTGGLYSALLAANAAGAVIGVLLLEGATRLQLGARAAIVCGVLAGLTMGLFPIMNSYPAAIVLLAVSGIFTIAFQSIAQTLVQMLAPPTERGRLVGLFNTAMLGLRAGSGVTVGVLGTFIGIRLSLEISSLAVVVVALVLLARESSGRPSSAPAANEPA